MTDAASRAIEDVIAEERRCILETRRELDRTRDLAAPRLDDSEFRGLALSGGGIRSATFNLGVLQARSARSELQRFDYLSTVSGGGYIGAWLTAWIHRRRLAFHKFASRRPQTAEGVVAPTAGVRTASPHVHALLSVERDLGGRSRTLAGDVPRNTEPETVSRLRSFSRYLAPRAGVFGLDAVTLATTWLRNVFLNLLVMLSMMGAVVVGVWLVAFGIHWIGGLSSLPLGPLCTSLGAMFFASFALQLYLLDPVKRKALDIAALQPAWVADSWVTRGTGLAFVICAGLWAAGFDATKSDFALATGVVIFMAIALLTGAFAAYTMELRIERRLGPRWRGAGTGLTKPIVVFLVAGLLCTLAVMGSLIAIRHTFAVAASALTDATRPMIQLTLAPAFALIAFSVCGSLFVGAVGRQYADGSREWWARLNAELVRAGIWWLLVGGLAFAAAGVADWIGTQARGWWGALLASGWIGSALTSIFGPRVKVHDEKRNRLWGRTLGVAAFVFGAGLVLLAAAGIHEGLKAASAIDERTSHGSMPNARAACQKPAANDTSDAAAASLSGCIKASAYDIADMYQVGDGQFVFWSFVLFALAFAFFGWRVDVNRFSLHDLYKLRLVRCYLGASNTRRRANGYTGFDPADDIRLEDVHRCQRPFHLLNAAVNLSVPTSLAWQQRKASSFTFSSLYCGFVAPRDDRDRDTRGQAPMPIRSYVATALYGRGQPSPDNPAADDDMDERSVTLGGAVATSGAAISPTAGMNTRPALAFILTLFNLRTGRWLLNPTHVHVVDRLTPRFGWRWLLQELFAKTGASGEFIHLSDGGHFDNLGIYELVRRRCRTIVCVDATADANRQFDDLGEVVRKCRVDLGVSIELDTKRLVPDPKSGFALARVVDGDIRYPEQNTGRLLYVKPGLGDNVRLRDLLTHLVREPEFPHVGTTDQFFNEGQFESYRRLGELIGFELVSALRAPRQ